MKRVAKLAFRILACLLLVGGLAAVSAPASAAVATIIRDQDNPARHPFVTTCTTSAGLNFSCSTPPIPAGQRVVIETVSISGFNVPAGVSVFFPFVATTTAGVRTTLAFDPPFVIAGLFQETRSIRFYADPGSVIQCDGSPDAGSLFGAAVFCTFSGYFVTLP